VSDPLSSELTVTIPMLQVPTFPQRCVRCGMESPDSTLRVFPETASTSESDEEPFDPAIVSVEVPACSACARRMACWSWLRWGILVVSMSVALVFWVCRYPVNWPIGLGGWAALLGLGILAVVPWAVLRGYLPLPIEIDIDSQSATAQYQFLDHSYAEEFAAFNAVPAHGGAPRPTDGSAVASQGEGGA